MGFSDDWADFVRDRRFDRWEERGGPGSGTRWVFDHPQRGLVAAVGIGGLLVVAGWMLTGSWVLPALIVMGGVSQYQMLRGERMLFEEWRQKTGDS